MPPLSLLTSHFSPPASALPHNPALSLWLSVDPLSDKYPGVTPYVYCADNPVNIIDPAGDSCVVLLADKSVGGLGHMAILVQTQNDKGEQVWGLWSKNGDNNGSLKQVFNNTVGTPDDQPCLDPTGNPVYFNTVEEFLSSGYNTEKHDGSVDAPYYTYGYLLPTTKEQDENIIEGMNTKLDEKYHFLNNNCSEAVVYSLRQGGIDLPRTKVGRGMIPVHAFNRIKRIHPEGVLLRPNCGN